MALQGLLGKVAKIADQGAKVAMQPVIVYPTETEGKTFDPTTGTYTGTAPASVTGRGLITEYSEHLVASGSARISDRQVIVMIDSLSGPVEFKKGVEVEQDGERIAPVSWAIDPANATATGHTADSFG